MSRFEVFLCSYTQWSSLASFLVLIYAIIKFNESLEIERHRFPTQTYGKYTPNVNIRVMCTLLVFAYLLHRNVPFKILCFNIHMRIFLDLKCKVGFFSFRMRIVEDLIFKNINDLFLFWSNLYWTLSVVYYFLKCHNAVTF